MRENELHGHIIPNLRRRVISGFAKRKLGLDMSTGRYWREGVVPAGRRTAECPSSAGGIAEGEFASFRDSLVDVLR
jgi:hypothetical protein